MLGRDASPFRMTLTATSAGTSADTLEHLLAAQDVGAAKSETVETLNLQQKVEGLVSWQELVEGTAELGRTSQTWLEGFDASHQVVDLLARC